MGIGCKWYYKVPSLDANGITKFPHLENNEKTHVTQTRNLARCGKATTIVFISIE